MHLSLARSHMQSSCPRPAWRLAILLLSEITRFGAAFQRMVFRCCRRRSARKTRSSARDNICWCSCGFFARILINGFDSQLKPTVRSNASDQPTGFKAEDSKGKSDDPCHFNMSSRELCCFSQVRSTTKQKPQ